MHLSRRLARPALLVLLLASPAIAWAWGKQGHRIVAELAAAELTPGAAAEVARLLQGEPDPTLPGIASWADELRDTDPELGRRTGRWHFINFPRGECVYAPRATARTAIASSPRSTAASWRCRTAAAPTRNGARR